MRVDAAFAAQLLQRLRLERGPARAGLPDPRFGTLTFTRRSLFKREYAVTNDGTPASLFEHAMYLHTTAHGPPHVLLDPAEASRMVARHLPRPDIEPYIPPRIDAHRVLYVVLERDGLVAYEADTRRGAVANGRRLT